MSATQLREEEAQLRREIELLEKERREGEATYNRKKELIEELKDKISAAKGDGDKISLITDELKAKALALKRVTWAELKEQNDDLEKLYADRVDRLKAEFKNIQQSRSLQRQLFLKLREKGISQFQTYSPGPQEQGDEQQAFSESSSPSGLQQQPSLSQSEMEAAEGGEEMQIPTIAGDIESPLDEAPTPAGAGLDAAPTPPTNGVPKTDTPLAVASTMNAPGTSEITAA